jgi:hypothetical protein
MKGTWTFQCTKCAFTLQMPWATLPTINPEVPHAKDGYLLSTDEWKEIGKICYGIEFLKIGESYEK